MSSLRRWMIPVWLLLALAPGLAAAASYPAEGPVTAPEYAPWTDEDYRYRIGAGDELGLRFTVNPDLNAPVVVGPDGRGVFPLIGSVAVAGMTAEQADRALSSAYASVLRSPQVEVLIASYSSAQIYVGGEVKEPGVKAVKGRITVTQAIMAAGGFAESARTRQVAVLRWRSADPRPQMRIVNVRDVLKPNAGGGDFLLEPGDVVFAPRSAIAEVDLFVKQYVTNLIPFSVTYGVATNGHF